MGSRSSFSFLTTRSKISCLTLFIEFYWFFISSKIGFRLLSSRAGCCASWFAGITLLLMLSFCEDAFFFATVGRSLSYYNSVSQSFWVCLDLISSCYLLNSTLVLSYAFRAISSTIWSAWTSLLLCSEEIGILYFAAVFISSSKTPCSSSLEIFSSSDLFW